LIVQLKNLSLLSSSGPHILEHAQSMRSMDGFNQETIDTLFADKPSKWRNSSEQETSPGQSESFSCILPG
jgi:hypothetical protein